MNSSHKKENGPTKNRQVIPAISAVLDDGALIEMVHRPDKKRSAFVFWKDWQWKIEPGFDFSPFQRLVPYSPNNNLIKNEVVLLPSEPEEYGSEEQLLNEIQSFIHRYVDLSSLSEKDR